ncbi:MAG: hypothetical protein VZQ62_00220 [Methanosphaera sp.]|nr:hypothetical protein [Methanosphaera sp.]
MQLLSKLNSLDNVADGSTRKLLTTATSSGSGNAVTAVSISGDTLTYTKGSTFSLSNHTHDAATSSAAGFLSAADKKKLNYTNITYATCSTAAATVEKVITIQGNENWSLQQGAIIVVKFSATNTANNPTFNVNNTGAKSVWYNTAVIATSNKGYAGTANRPMIFMYDGTNYVFLGWSLDANDNTIPSAYCSTAAATAAKTASCTSYVLLAKSYIQVIVTQTNTSQTALTLNINSKGAKPIYINGTASSTTNYTLPAGSYFVYYDGTNYYFRTDGKITGSITGSSMNSNVALTNPTSGTWYYPTWVTGATNNGDYRHNVNDGFRYYSLQGTTSAAGRTILQIGNATATGTAGNKVGELRIYAEKAGYATIKATAAATAETVHTLPNTAGTILNTGTTSFTQTLTSGTEIGSIKINGTTTKIYAPATGSVTTSLASAHQTYYLTGVQTTSAGSSDLYNSYMSSSYTGIKYVTFASQAGGALYVDDKEVVTGLYYEIS